MEFLAVLPDKSIVKVEGGMTKLKGYSKFKFFMHKRDRLWHVREFFTGQRLSSESSMVAAKRSARGYLDKETKTSGKNLDAVIKALPHLNKDIKR